MVSVLMLILSIFWSLSSRTSPRAVTAGAKMCQLRHCDRSGLTVGVETDLGSRDHLRERVRRGDRSFRRRKARSRRCRRWSTRSPTSQESGKKQVVSAVLA